MNTKNTHYSAKNYKGFTLVELIVVITILTILGTIAFIQIGGFAGSARDGSRVSDMTNISKGLDIYRIRTGSYPTPSIPTGASSLTTVSYSGSTLFTQWAIGDSVIAAIASFWSKMSKKPMDPLRTTTEYVYSVSANTAEYQIKTDWEGDSVTYTPIINQASASSGNPTLSYIKGNYNGLIVRTNTTPIYFLALPSLITSATGTLTHTGIASKILLHGQTNSGGIVYDTTATKFLVYSSGALPSTDPERILFASGIANAYSGTALAGQSNIKSFIDAGTNTGTLATLGGGIVSSSFWGSAVASQQQTPPVTPTYSCTGALVTANANISNTTGLSVDTAYQTSNSGNACHYACKPAYGGTNCETNLNIITEPLCTTTAGWLWVDATTDTIGDGFCISPRVTGWSEYISWMDIGTSYSWTRTNASPLTASPAYADNPYGVTYDLGSYTCKALGTATTDTDTGDTLVGRMSWINTNKTDSSALDDIDWVTIPGKPATLSVPALMIADCIDGARSLTGANTYEWVTYAEYSGPANDATSRTKMNKYLLWWTKAAGGHLPSAYSDISSEVADSLTTNKGEYQIACDAGKFWAITWWTDWNKTSTTSWTDDADGKWIWLAAVGTTAGSNWGRYARIVGESGCGDQDANGAGTRGSSSSARFVVRP